MTTTFVVRVRYNRGSLRKYTVAKTTNKANAAEWANQLRAALRESLTSDSLTVYVARLKSHPLTKGVKALMSKKARKR